MTLTNTAPMSKIAPNSNAPNECDVDVLVACFEFAGSLFKSYITLITFVEQIGSPKPSPLLRSCRLIRFQFFDTTEQSL